MAKRREADEELRDDVRSECVAFGVDEIVFHAAAAAEPKDDDDVIIYVRFGTAEGAARACERLNGRFFAKRRIDVAPFDEQRFAKRDLD